MIKFIFSGFKEFLKRDSFSRPKYINGGFTYKTDLPLCKQVQRRFQNHFLNAWIDGQTAKHSLPVLSNHC